MNLEELVALLKEEVRSREKKAEKYKKEEKKSLVEPEPLPENVIDLSAYLKKINSKS
tara:strand:- start:138 stop:308 length:171 start_codon:yes stop_codon:yes gene_type:complete